MPYFNSNCYQGMDGPKGFYQVFRDLYLQLEVEERDALVKDPGALEQLAQEAVDFGNSTTSLEPFLKSFYDKYLHFSTVKSFSHADEYNLYEIDDRRIRRIAESKNKKKRELARKEFNETVRNLTAWIKKRDPRYQQYQALLDQRSKENHAKMLEMQLKDRQERLKLAASYQEAEWTKVNDEDEVEEEQDLYIDMYECIACVKQFKSKGQLISHEKSKKHKEAIARLREAMLLEEEEIATLVPGKANVDHEFIDEDPETKDQVGSQVESNPLVPNQSLVDTETNDILFKEPNNVDTNKPLEEANEIPKVKYEKKKKPTLQDELSMLLDGNTPELENSMEKLDLDPKKKKRRAAKPKKKPDPNSCHVCRETFASRTKLFEHIRASGHAQFSWIKQNL